MAANNSVVVRTGDQLHLDSSCGTGQSRQELVVANTAPPTDTTWITLRVDTPEMVYVLVSRFRSCLSGSATGTRPCGSRPSGSSLGGLGPVEVVALVGSLRITQEELAAPSPTGGFRLWRWEHPGQVGAVFGLTRFTTATNYDQRSIETVPAPLYGTEEGYRTSRTGPG